MKHDPKIGPKNPGRYIFKMCWHSLPIHYQGSLRERFYRRKRRSENMINALCVARRETRSEMIPCQISSMLFGPPPCGRTEPRCARTVKKGGEVRRDWQRGKRKKGEGESIWSKLEPQKPPQEQRRETGGAGQDQKLSQQIKMIFQENIFGSCHFKDLCMLWISVDIYLIEWI